MMERFARLLGAMGRGERPKTWVRASLLASWVLAAFFGVSVAQGHPDWTVFGLVVAGLVGAGIWTVIQRNRV